MSGDNRQSVWTCMAAGGMAALAALLPAGPATAQPSRVALVIGNGAYTGFPPAPACPAAARAVAEKLRAAKYEVVERNDLTTGGFDGAVGDFITALARAPGATAFVYVCTRGASLNERPFLLPVSANLTRPTDLFTQGVLAKVMYDALARGSAGPAVVALDVVQTQTGALLTGFDGLAEGAGIDGLAAITVVEASASGAATPLADALAAVLDRPAVQNGQLVSAAQEQIAAAAGTSIAVVHQPKATGHMVGEQPPPPPPPAPPPPAPAPVAAAEPAAQPASPPPEPSPQAAAAPPPTMPEEHLMTYDDRRRIQEALRTLGYYTIQIDGIFGPETRAAIRKYQMQLMAEPTGRLTPEQAGLLVQGR
ncbi:peptidoglycan-binding protein [Vineibacter terrae]|nr:peptidoglycan-binding protein [Vineibacter terrae]